MKHNLPLIYLFLLILSTTPGYSQLTIKPTNTAYNTSAPPQMTIGPNDILNIISGTGIGYQVFKQSDGSSLNMTNCTATWEATYGVMYPNSSYTNTSAKTSTISSFSDQGAIRWVNAKQSCTTTNGVTTCVAKGKIKVTFSNTSTSGAACAQNGQTANADVNIRYIGNPGTVSINGYSNPANVSCGAQNITLTTTAAENATHYDWKNIPSSWVGSRTTTTNSATFQVDAGTPGSSLTVTARRTDTPDINTTASNSVAVNRPLPQLTSSSPTGPLSLCTPSALVVASAIGTNADKFIWTPSGGARINGASTPQTVAGNVNISAASADGSYTVQAYSSACQVASVNSLSRTVYYGPASLTSGTYETNGSTYGLVEEGGGTPNPNALCYTGPSFGGVIKVNYSRLLTRTWARDYSVPANVPWSQNQYGGVNITFQAPNQEILFELTYGNNCGNTTKYFGFRSVSCFQALTVFPNPSAQDLLTVQLDNVEDESVIPTEISLFSEKSTQPVKTVSTADIFKRKAFKDKNKIEINVRELPRGVYYLHVTHAKIVNKGKEKIRVVLD